MQSLLDNNMKAGQKRRLGLETKSTENKRPEDSKPETPGVEIRGTRSEKRDGYKELLLLFVRPSDCVERRYEGMSTKNYYYYYLHGR